MRRKAKIICTIGPACRSEQMISELIKAGMDVARLNFSHGTHDEHLAAIKTLRLVSHKLGKPVAILQDLQGPKIRIGCFAEGPVVLIPGKHFTITTQDVPGDASRVSTTYPQLAHDVAPGDFILLHDGLIRLQVLRTDGTDVTSRVVNGGVLSDRSGINLPGVKVSAEALTDKDRRDLEFGLAHGVDYVALSFVRDAEDIVELKRIIGDRKVPVIAKLEKPEALENLDAIIAEADAIMVARGDLGVEISTARVPVVQKFIIEKCHHAGIPVITATQMLDSMITQPTPTRAEASDVANAVFDGSDAVMLSGETAFGTYPVVATQMMANIIEEAEKTDYFRLKNASGAEHPSFVRSICHAAYHIARGIDVKYVVVFTKTGPTARIMSKYRPNAPILALAPYEETCRRTALYWGTTPLLMEYANDTEDAIRKMEVLLLKEGLIQKGDNLVIVQGATMQVGGTNMLRLYTQG